MAGTHTLGSFEMSFSSKLWTHLMWFYVGQECCNSPYGNEYFREYAEEIPGKSTEEFSKAAADNGVFLIAGE
jgi:hypothetical protein